MQTAATKGVRAIGDQSYGAPAGSHKGTGLESLQHRKELLSPDAAFGSGLRTYSTPPCRTNVSAGCHIPGDIVVHLEPCLVGAGRTVR